MIKKKREKIKWTSIDYFLVVFLYIYNNTLIVLTIIIIIFIHSNHQIGENE